jgi:hypothetical protein
LRGKARAGLLKTEKTFGAAADQFEKEYGIITEGQRSQRWARAEASLAGHRHSILAWILLRNASAEASACLSAQY